LTKIPPNKSTSIQIVVGKDKYQEILYLRRRITSSKNSWDIMDTEQIGKYVLDYPQSFSPLHQLYGEPRTIFSTFILKTKVSLPSQRLNSALNPIEYD